MNKTQRQICLDALYDVHINNAYSTIVLDKYLNKQKNISKSYITKLFYGVLERDITLTHIINTYSKKSCNKLDKAVQLILKLGLYELKYMDSVPDNAAVNENVELCRYMKKKSATSFVNAILRSFIRDKKQIKIDESSKNYFSIMYSCPRWIVDMWIKSYGKENTEKILKSTVTTPVIYARVNTNKISTNELLEKLAEENINATAVDYIENCIILHKPGDIEDINAFKEGLFYIQDISSQFCAKIVDAKPNEVVFDMCAAPGSKSFTIAQYMKESGEIHSFDIHEHKIKLIEKAAVKLEISNIKALLGDASKYNPELPLADKVLCDVPCSGLGIIRKKPDIKFKEKAKIENLPPIQLKILKNASRYVKNSGELIYSTCTLNTAENEEVVKAFLEGNTDFEICEVSQDFSKISYIINCDGFFVTKFRRCEKKE